MSDVTDSDVTSSVVSGWVSIEEPGAGKWLMLECREWSGGGGGVPPVATGSDTLAQFSGVYDFGGLPLLGEVLGVAGN